MSPGKKAQVLPKADSTTSTNYGPSFEMSSTAIAVLRACKQTNDFRVWLNYRKYEPWDDIVAEIDGKILCVQLKHTVKFDKKKLDTCLRDRRTILDKYPSEKDSIIFIYFAITSDKGIRSIPAYHPVELIPDFLNLLLTNEKHVYYDTNSEHGDTYFCMNQNNITTEYMDIKQALVDYIGKQYENSLKDIQTIFADYLRKRYLRLTIEKDDPLTKPEVCELLGYAILSKFAAEFKQDNSNVEVSSSFEEIMDTSSVVVFNHRWSSLFKENIWNHLIAYLKEKKKTQLTFSKLDKLWMEQKLHMPLLSKSRDSDKLIFRTLEIAGFEPKVLILRPKVFRIKQGQTIITLLQNLVVASSTLLMQTGENQESFKYANVDMNELITNKNIQLHQDSFCKVAKDYCKGENGFPNCIVEAHDENSYVNDFNIVGQQIMPALFAAIRIKQIDIKIIEQILRLGANVNVSITGGSTPIFFAIDANRPDILELLLQQDGANPDPADKDGIRPLFNACTQNKRDMVDILVKYKADRNASDVNGVAPLFMAYNKRNFEIMRVLLKYLDRPAAANTQGNHILHQAATDGSVECLKCILDCCPNIKIFMTGDVLGKTQLDIARENGSQEFVDILSSFGKSSMKNNRSIQQ